MNTCKYCLLIPLLIVVNSVTCRTIYMELNAPTSEELSYLKKYGYLPEEQGDVDFAYTPHSISDAVRRLQDFAGLPKTGTLDDKTRSLFSKRRCGVKDIENGANRRRRYIIQDGWGKRIITYKVANGSSTMPKSRIDTLVAKGLAIWAPHGNLQFDRVDSGKADIVISFVRGKHGDGFPFDGRGRVVAHAFPPPFGVLHFDDDELWGDNPDDDKEDVTDFFAVAVHEIGHALGLSHSKVKESVMYPYYQVPVERLHIDDIMGMQELYLKDQKPEEAELVSTDSPLITQSSFVPRFTKPNGGSDEENDIPDLCYTNYDTVQVIQGKIFVFEEEWMWVLPRRKVIEEGYPKKFHDVFVGLPKDISAIRTIYEKRNGNIAIFSGKKYWEFDSSFNFVRRGRISEYSIPPYVSELTTVFLSNYNNKTYLIEYERFWRYDEDTRLMDEGYPKEMSAWRQVPYPVDAALIWKNDTYFFHGPRFWRFDNELVRAHEYYPLPTAQIWFPCQSNHEMDKYTINDGP